MGRQSIKVGNIILVKDKDGNEKVARVLNISRSSETVMVMYLDEALTDLYMDSVSLLNCSLYSQRKIEK